MIIRLLSSASVSTIPFIFRTTQAPLNGNDPLAFIGVMISIMGALVALFAAKSSASKSTVEGLNTLIVQMRADLDDTRAELKQTRLDLADEKRQRELSDASNAYLVSTFTAQHPAEVQFALAIRRGDEDAPNGNERNSGRDSDHKLRGGKRRGA